MKRAATPLLLASGLLLALSLQAAADDFHYNNVLIGDRASGLAGAYTAISDDASGLYYNPAGVAFATSQNISGSVTAYQSLTKKYKGVIAGNPWERKSYLLLPDFFGIVKPVGRVTLGFSYAVPDAIHENQDQIFYNLPPNVSRSVINFNNDDFTYDIGPSVAVALTKDVSVGLTLYVHERSSQVILNQLTNFSPAGYLWTNLNVETREQGVRPILGFAWSPVEKFSLGLAASRVMLFDSSTTIQGTCSSDIGAPGCPPSPAFTSVSSDSKRKYPLQLAAGAAYFASPSFLVSADATYFFNVRDPNFGDKQAVLNLAAGTEYYFSKEWAMRAGLFTNRANTPELDPGQLNQREHMDLYGTSLSLSRFTKSTSVSLGGNVSYGTGKAQIERNNPAIQDASTFAWTIFLSSSYSY